MAHVNRFGKGRPSIDEYVISQKRFLATLNYFGDILVNICHHKDSFDLTNFSFNKYKTISDH